MQYNMLVLLPETNKPQEYKIEVRLISRCAKVKHLRDSFAEMDIMGAFWLYENNYTCKVTVDFIDVAVALSFQAVVKGWIDCQLETKPMPAMKSIRPIIKFLPHICKYSSLAVAAYLSYRSLDNYFDSYSHHDTSLFILSSLLFAFLLYRCGYSLGVQAYKNFNTIFHISYIHLSNADRNLAEDDRKGAKSALLKSTFYLSFNILLGVVVSLITAEIVGN